ncbi:GTP-binding protein [Acetobacter orientalis]|uniref:GTP-binding protein n=1 Tax=Acetobacter orientalis TaxID=146474 RepID=A0A2Z5ZI35_9PROT|nr:GTP-binding protein [Acetobacter orientalis]
MAPEFFALGPNVVLRPNILSVRSCRMPYAVCRMPYAVCRMPYAVWGLAPCDSCPAGVLWRHEMFLRAETKSMSALGVTI